MGKGPLGLQVGHEQVVQDVGLTAHVGDALQGKTTDVLTTSN